MSVLMVLCNDCCWDMKRIFNADLGVIVDFLLNFKKNCLASNRKCGFFSLCGDESLIWKKILVQNWILLQETSYIIQKWRPSMLFWDYFQLSVAQLKIHYIFEMLDVISKQPQKPSSGLQKHNVQDVKTSNYLPEMPSQRTITNCKIHSLTKK